MLNSKLMYEDGLKEAIKTPSIAQKRIISWHQKWLHQK
jgi:hypothetical protein